MGFPVILQVVGYQNSGKTTVITKLLKQLTQHRIKTGVLKHHGHDGKLDIHDSGKDTESHRNAGAFITGISASEGTILSMNHEIPIEKAIELYKVMHVECVLIEGYKKFHYPRVILCRNKKDRDILIKTSDPVAVISEGQLETDSGVPHFSRTEEDRWVHFLVEYLASRVNEERTYDKTV